MSSLKEDILAVLAYFYPTGLSIGQIIQELPGVKKPKQALIQSVLNELLDDDEVEIDRQTGLWYVA